MVERVITLPFLFTVVFVASYLVGYLSVTKGLLLRKGVLLPQQRGYLSAKKKYVQR